MKGRKPEEGKTKFLEVVTTVISVGEKTIKNPGGKGGG